MNLILKCVAWLSCGLCSLISAELSAQSASPPWYHLQYLALEGQYGAMYQSVDAPTQTISSGWMIFTGAGLYAVGQPQGPWQVELGVQVQPISVGYRINLPRHRGIAIGVGQGWSVHGGIHYNLVSTLRWNLTAVGRVGLRFLNLHWPKGSTIQGSLTDLAEPFAYFQDDTYLLSAWQPVAQTGLRGSVRLWGSRLWITAHLYAMAGLRRLAEQDIRYSPDGGPALLAHSHTHGHIWTTGLGLRVDLE